MSASSHDLASETLHPDATPRLWENVIVDDTGDDIFLLHPFEPRWALTNRTGLLISRLLDGSTTVGQAASALASSGSVTHAQALEDTLSFTGELRDAGLLRNLPPPDQPSPKRVREPHRLTIYITEECNLRCKHCFVVEGRMPEPKLTARNVRELIDQHAALHPGALIAFTGGEAMLRDDCIELMQHAHQRTGMVTLNTNGLLIENERTARALIDTRAAIQVSLDGADPEVHDFIRGKGTWEKTWRAIELLCEAGGARRLRIATTLTRCALGQVHELIRKAEGLDLYEVRFLILNRLKAADTHWDQIAPDNEELLSVYRYLLLELPRSGRTSRTLVQGEFPGFVPHPDPKGKHWCPIGETTIVDSQGDTYACPGLMIPEYRTGSLAESDLDTIQRSERHRRLREVMLQRPWVIEDCRVCAWRNFCQGGCQAFTQLRTGSPWVMDEFCDFRRELYRETARLEAAGVEIDEAPGC